MVKNEQIITNFKLLIKQTEDDIIKKSNIQNKFRLKTFKNALDIILQYPKQIKKGDDLADFIGIGPGIIRRIDEIIENNVLKELKHQNINNNMELIYINNLKQVFGIGDNRAFILVNKYNIKTVDELIKAVSDGFVKVPSNILMGLKYYNIYQENIPRKEITKYNNLINHYIDNKTTTAIICGSYRRLKTTSNDIDILLVDSNYLTKKSMNNSNILHNFIQNLINANIIIDNLTTIDVHSKFMGFCKLKNNSPVRRIDIRFMPYESYYFALLYFTGSKSFNQKIRNVAKSYNYLLNEYGLFNKKTKKKIKTKSIITSEKDIFELLNMDYLEPQFRI